MRSFCLTLMTAVLAFPLVGCGDNANSDAPKAEELSPDFGAKAAEKMKNMNPEALQPPKPVKK